MGLVLFEFLCLIVSRSFCMAHCVVSVAMSLDLVFIKYWSCVVCVSMSLGITSDRYVSLYCPSFYATLSHFCYEKGIYVLLVAMWLRSVWVLVLPEFPCHLVWHPFCMYLYFLQVSMSLGLTSVLYGSLCCLSFHVTWSEFHYVWVLALLEFLCRSVSLSWSMGPCVVWVSMSLGLTWVLYRSLCSPSFYVTWSHFRSLCISMCSEFVCH
jgi:hypothetical protein